MYSSCCECGCELLVTHQCCAQNPTSRCQWTRTAPRNPTCTTETHPETHAKSPDSAHRRTYYVQQLRVTTCMRRLPTATDGGPLPPHTPRARKQHPSSPHCPSPCLSGARERSRRMHAHVCRPAGGAGARGAWRGRGARLRAGAGARQMGSRPLPSRACASSSGGRLKVNGHVGGGAGGHSANVTD